MNASIAMDHVGLNVSDLEATAAWYSTAFGLREEFRFAFESLGFRGIILVHPSGWRVELISRPGAVTGIRVDHPVDAALTLGFSHFAIRVDRVQETYDRLLALGASERLSPRPGPERGMPMAFVADPEGNLVEVLTRDPATATGDDQPVRITSAAPPA